MPYKLLTVKDLRRADGGDRTHTSCQGNWILSPRRRRDKCLSFKTLIPKNILTAGVQPKSGFRNGLVDKKGMAVDALPLLHVIIV
jgi:hypothetical protein